MEHFAEWSNRDLDLHAGSTSLANVGYGSSVVEIFFSWFGACARNPLCASEPTVSGRPNLFLRPSSAASIQRQPCVLKTKAMKSELCEMAFCNTFDYQPYDSSRL